MADGITLAALVSRRRAQAMRTKKIGVLCGGLSAEREVSLRTGEAIAATLIDRGFDARRVFVDRDIDLALRQERIDIAFVALHGRYGEDGCVQGLLELLGIPYTGSNVMASALAMNKVKAKQLFRLHNLPTPPYYVLGAELKEAAIEAHGAFGFPAVVKPCHEGSSVGVSLARDPAELEAACDEAFRFDDEVLVERYVPGREISVAILNDRALGAIEIVPAQPFYDYGAKYTAGKSEYHMPARLSPERYRGVMTQALAAHRALGASGASRVDMIVSDRGNEVVLEVNTIPGMTATSLLPKIAAHAGLDFGALLEEILGSATLHAVPRARERRVAQLPFSGPEKRDVEVERH
jgi:D-alanine-D-alanine ligase